MDDDLLPSLQCALSLHAVVVSYVKGKGVPAYAIFIASADVMLLIILVS
jgi:hypothetical protein